MGGCYDVWWFGGGGVTRWVTCLGDLFELAKKKNYVGENEAESVLVTQHLPFQKTILK